MPGERSFPGLDQTHLTDRRRRLQLVDALGTLAEPEPQDTFRDGPGTHQDHVVAEAAQADEFLRPALDRRAIETPAGGGEQGTADLDHPPPRSRQTLAPLGEPSLQ